MKLTGQPKCLPSATLPPLPPSAAPLPQDLGRKALKWLLRDARQIVGGPPGIPFPVGVSPTAGGGTVTYKGAF